MSSSDRLRRLRFARLLVHQAKGHARIDHEGRNAACILSLQDAVETVLLVVAEAVEASVSRTMEFDKYFAAINAKIAPRTLALQSPISRLNRGRVQAKHSGIFPSNAFAREMLPVVDEFLNDVCQSYLNWDWNHLGLSTLLQDTAATRFLKEAEQAIEHEHYKDALVSARKALFLAFESAYDVRGFEAYSNSNALFAVMSSSAPSWAKSLEYVQNNVGSPFDYIVIDHADLDSRLFKLGADPVMFWNVWRLTPAVYRFPDDKWVVKRELDKTERGDIESDAIYVVEAVGELLLLKEAQARRMRITPSTVGAECQTGGSF